MSDLIIGVVVDVLSHVFIQHREGGGIGWIATAARDFGVLDAAEFVVLDPKVGLEYLQRRWEPKQGRVSGVRPPRLLLRFGVLVNSPAPIVPAPNGDDLPRKERRLIELFRGLTLFSRLSSGGRISLLPEPFAVGLLIAFMPVESQRFALRAAWER